MSRVSVNARHAHERCALCHEPLEHQLEAQRCRGCQTGFHTACSRELGGCPTLGCTTPDEEPSWLEAFDTPRPAEPTPTPQGALGELSGQFSPTYFLLSGLLAVVILGKTLWNLPHGLIGSLALALAFAVWVGFEKERAIGPLQFLNRGARERRKRHWRW